MVMVESAVLSAVTVLGVPVREEVVEEAFPGIKVTEIAVTAVKPTGLERAIVFTPATVEVIVMEVWPFVSLGRAG